MCEVTRQNFKTLFPQIKEALQKCKFISIDLEFSALIQDRNHSYSLFDSPVERYRKLRNNIEKVIPIQIGLTAFSYNDNNNTYLGDTYTFFVAPPSFGTLDKNFLMNTRTLNFLSAHKFDFNKFINSGIPYLTRGEEEELRKNLASGELLNIEFDYLVEDAIDLAHSIISIWYAKSKTGDIFEVKQLTKVYGNRPEILYILHKVLRNRFDIWTYQENGNFLCKRLDRDELEHMSISCRLETEIIDYLCGFTHVFRLLTEFNKVIVGHNLMQDLMIMLNNFDAPLPKCYFKFKKIINQLFPMIFDTKSLFYELRKTIPRDCLPEKSGLEDLYIYFKGGIGRHLITNHVIIETNINGRDMDAYHDAGWDSFCAGYIFLRLGHYNVGRNGQTHEIFYWQILHHLSEYKNRVNIIQGSTNYINFGGDDPETCRPSWLHVESTTNKIDMNDLTDLLGRHGRCNIRKLDQRRVLIAPDNFRASETLLADLRKNKKYKVEKYSRIKHSPIARMSLLIGSVTISGCLATWLLYKTIRS